MIKIYRYDNIFDNCDEARRTFNRIRYGNPMAHMAINENLYLYLVFDQHEQEDNFCEDHSDIVIERYDFYDDF